MAILRVTELKINLFEVENEVPNQVFMYHKCLQEAMLINTKIPMGKQVCDCDP